ncbi:MAG: hypothetical protein JOZ18_23730 [Chloroflexi bacterium]|nr:hypothetical protein [Chloroflexota bacterium]
MKQDFAHKWIYDRRAFFLLTTLISIIGLNACQPTPTTPPVVSKQQAINKTVKNNTQNTNLLKGVPQTFTYHATQGAVTLNVNAQVQLPPTSRIPVTTVQPNCFTQETVNKLINTFMPGKQLYELNTIGPRSRMEKLYTLTKALQLPGARSNLEITTQERNIFYYMKIWGGNNFKFSPAFIQQQIPNTPATITRVPTTGQLQTVNESDLANSAGKVVSKGYHGQQLNVTADSGKGYDMSLYVEAFTSPHECDANFANHDITDVYNYSDLTGNARGMSMSLAQAKTLAQNTLQALGATDMGLTKVQLGTLIPLTSSDNPNTMKQAYGLWFTRHVSGVPTTLDLTDTEAQDAPSYAYERIFMLINDAGVIEFSWDSPMHTTGTVSSNATIKSFNDAMNTFKEQFFIHYAQNDTSKGTTTYTINQITLGLMRVQIKDQPDTYMMTPVWDFFGSINPKRGPLTFNGYDFPTNYSVQSFLTINAIDGSIIDRKQGY